MKDRASWTALALATLLVVGIGIDRRELDGTTAFYAALAAQVADTGRLVPLEHGPTPYVLKPPLVFWSTAWLFDTFGVDDWTSTLVSRLLGALCVLLVARLATLRDGPTAGWWAAMAMLATTSFLENTTTMRLDTTLLAGLLLSFVALFEDKGAWRPWAFYLGVTIGTLGKGPPGMLPLALAPLLWLPPRRLDRTWIAAAGLLLPIPLWFLGLQTILGSAFQELGADLAGGYERGALAWLRSSFDHLLVRPVESSPHIAVLAVLGAWQAWRQWRDPATPLRRRRGTLILGLWIALVLAATFAKPSQRLRYLLPALPPVAVWIGAWIASKRPSWRPVALPFAFAVIAVTTWFMPLAWWPENHRSVQARATMKAVVDSEIGPGETILLIETDRHQRYGRQWAGRDWAYLHLRREVEAIRPDEAAARAGRLALVHVSSVDRVPEALVTDELARTSKARLVRIPTAFSEPDSAREAR